MELFDINASKGSLGDLMVRLQMQMAAAVPGAVPVPPWGDWPAEIEAMADLSKDMNQEVDQAEEYVDPDDDPEYEEEPAFMSLYSYDTRDMSGIFLYDLNRDQADEFVTYLNLFVIDRKAFLDLEEYPEFGPISIAVQYVRIITGLERPRIMSVNVICKNEYLRNRVNDLTRMFCARNPNIVVTYS